MALIFETSVLLLTIVFLLLIRKFDHNAFRKFGIIAVGVLLFEYFTQALWFNNNLASWAYLYLDVSWIITIGWATIILVTVTLIDLYLPQVTELKRFILYLVGVTVVGVVAESVVLAIGVRTYSQAVLDTLSGYLIGNVPVEALYYIPVFMALVISFSRYWEIAFAQKTKKVVAKASGRKKR